MSPGPDAGDHTGRYAQGDAAGDTADAPGSPSADLLARFHAAAAQVGAEVTAALAATVDWSESGARRGQYRVDLVADQICVSGLRAAGFRVLSEESGLTGAADAPVVVVDPLDGSTNASRGLRWCATSLCLVDDAGPLAAWILDHGSAEVVTATRGGGAERAGRRLEVVPCADLSAAVIGVSGLPSHHFGWAQFRALGAAALDISAVAAGILDGWCDMSTDAHGVWDYLAAVLVCTEAGGVAVDVHGRDLCVLDPEARRTPVVASHPDLLARLLAERTGGRR